MADNQPTSVVETWKPVVGYEGMYEVSDLGRVKSCERMCLNRYGNGYKRVAERMLRPSTDIGGYKKVTLAANGNVRNVAVHLLVLVAFAGARPEGMEACHNNGDASDARLGNLRWDTAKANQGDRKKHGTYYAGDNHPWSKLSKRDVAFIKSHYIPRSRTYGQHALARRFGVHQATVYNILHGNTWVSVEGDDLERINES